MNRTVLITGASRGIGRAIALAFAAEGDRIAINYHTNEAAAQATAADCRALGAQAEIFRADVACRAEVFAMVRAVERTFGPVEVLVNNAGIAQQKLFTDITEADWRRMTGTHLDGTFYCCQAVLPDMIRAHAGRIINISSMWGQTGASCEVHYSAVKAGIQGLTMALAKEVGPSGILVNAIAPGVIDTEMNALLDAETRAALDEETPLCRAGRTEEIASAVVFLAGPGSSFITGQILGVNGGFIT
jgi:3-oxoacyl-[acyl-carrier protein] reductase